MTRKKKTRNPGSISIRPNKDSKESDFSSKDKKPKKKSGKISGNRQQEAVKKSRSQSSAAVNKDPRIGSKKPIVLTKAPVKEEKVKSKKPKLAQGIAPIKVIETGPSIAEQIAAIEADEKLQLILDKQEDGDLLTESEVSYYNKMMDKHEALAEQLDDEDDTEDEQQTDLSEDDLWDKLDSSDLSKFE
ncbi:GTPase-activating protein [Thalassotalea sp. M1531]|uniref:GTPase-activating protein n=1 Tax=Thalassotalea algicola TaxID=2716224 RepID=A0A7Y0L9S0_9GAMM|nr:Der GTPase-activating protein YihI [Thalassotalea algicola]NMP30570.1 GTPase-activating protein [Thalassotalea algicola]